jgi:hypothetical protein
LFRGEDRRWIGERECREGKRAVGDGTVGEVEEVEVVDDNQLDQRNVMNSD